MCKAIEDIKNKTAREKTLQLAKNMLALNKLSYDEIAKVTGLTVDEIKELDTRESA